MLKEMCVASYSLKKEVVTSHTTTHWNKKLQLPPNIPVGKDAGDSIRFQVSCVIEIS
jgi:hypothetical protein